MLNIKYFISTEVYEIIRHLLAMRALDEHRTVLPVVRVQTFIRKQIIHLTAKYTGPE